MREAAQFKKALQIHRTLNECDSVEDGVKLAACACAMFISHRFKNKPAEIERAGELCAMAIVDACAAISSQECSC